MNNQMTYREALNWASSCIRGQNVDQTAPEFLLMMRHDWTTTDLVINRSRLMDDVETKWFQRAIQRLNNHEPAQYIVEKAPFYGRTFMVNQDVLVPESETEELVEWVLETNQNCQSLQVLDLCTGSGVIGITLKLERPDWQVSGSDISGAALAVARHNAQTLGANVDWIQSDLFDEIKTKRFDLIVSNPPYIDRHDQSLMDEAVVKYEPAVALYAEHGGLAIYEKMVPQLAGQMTRGGIFFGETGFDQEKTIPRLFEKTYPRAQVTTRHDVNDLMRMVRVTGINDQGNEMER